MLRNVREPTIRQYPGTRPMALLILASGVAIGGALAGLPIDPPGPSMVPTIARPASDLAVVRKPVRVIPLPVRDQPMASRR